MTIQKLVSSCNTQIGGQCTASARQRRNKAEVEVEEVSCSTARKCGLFLLQSSASSFCAYPVGDHVGDDGRAAWAVSVKGRQRKERQRQVEGKTVEGQGKAVKGQGKAEKGQGEVKGRAVEGQVKAVKGGGGSRER